MEIGLFTAHEEYSPSTLLDHASLAEEHGFDTVWTSDHIHPWWHTDAQCGAAFPWLGAALQQTDRVKMGTGVTPPIARYHPGMIAQVFATLGAMYPGRPFVCIGTGESMNEVPLGYEWPEYSERRKRLIDACEIITQLWDGGFLDYDGHYWTTNSLNLYTLPEQRVPLYIAANGPMSAGVAGRYADGLLTIVDIDRYENVLVPAVEKGADKAGRNPDDVKRIRQLLVSYDPDDYEAALEATGFWRGVPAVGFDAEIPDPRDIEKEGRKMALEEMTNMWTVTTDPEDVLEALEASEAAGFDEVEIHSASPSERGFIEMMSEEILPHF